jgi:acetyl esterase/lipase
VLVFIHGGGWMIGDKATHRRIGKGFAAQGYVVVNINYRLAPGYQFPVQLQDVSKAIYYVYNNIQEYGGDKTQLFLGGDSAGAHLASWYAAALQKQELFKKADVEEVIPKDYIRGLLLFYGAYDLETALETDFPGAQILGDSFLGKDKEIYKQRAQITSPIRHLTEDYPPAFICSGTKDSLHSESVQFEQELTQLNLPHKKLFFGEDYKCHHGFLNLYFYNCAKIAMEEAGEFMDKFNN